MKKKLKEMMCDIKGHPTLQDIGAPQQSMR